MGIKLDIFFCILTQYIYPIMKETMNFLMFSSLIFLFMTCSPQQAKKVSDNNPYKKEDKWLHERQYIYPVDNSELIDPRGKDYKLIHNWEFNNKKEFLEDWERLDGIRGSQLMHYRDNDRNFGFVKDGDKGYLHLKPLYHNPRVVYKETWPEPYSLSYQYSTGECITKEPVLYGYFEARMKLSGSKGTHSGFWMFSKGYKGNALEIDIMESTSERLLDTRRHRFTTNFSEYNHTRGDLHKQGFVYQDNLTNSLSDAFHIYAVEWTPFDLRFYIDNQLIRVDKIPQEYEIFPCYVRLGISIDHWNYPTEKVLDPVIIDWVRVYQKDDMKSGYQRPQIEYKDKIIKSEEWVIASIKDPSPAQNYYWETDGNADSYIDENNDIHFKLNRGKSRSTIVGLRSVDKKGKSEINDWKENVVFTDILPMNFKLLIYKTKCNEEGKGLITVKSQDLSKYGVHSTTFNVYLTNKNGAMKGKPIETIKVASPGEGKFWLDPAKQYWIEHSAQWPGGGPKSTARILVYPVLDPTFSPRVYMATVNGRQKIFVDGIGVNPNQIHRWSLYRTDLQNSFKDYLESYESPGSKTFCFDLSKYSGYDYFVIVHEMEQADRGKCFPIETREMYFTSKRYNKKPPSNAFCP